MEQSEILSDPRNSLDWPVAPLIQGSPSTIPFLILFFVFYTYTICTVVNCQVDTCRGKFLFRTLYKHFINTEIHR